jgi:hypothetical protein
MTKIVLSMRRVKMTFVPGEPRKKYSKMPTRGSLIMAISKTTTTRVDGEKP